jgi:transcriptional regulator with XRE-family HTH domain
MTAALQLGGQIKAIRLGAGYSLRTLGGLTGIPWTTIDGYEGGKKIPADNFLRIADALNHHTFEVDGYKFTVGRSDKVLTILAASEQLKLEFFKEYDYSKASVRIGPGKITVSFDGSGQSLQSNVGELGI